jgi:8-oxo-dGTP diphosphatase
LFIVRHAIAGDRSKWSTEDRHRPLTKRGHRQARAIADRLEDRGIERIISSPYDRCTQTVDPLARLTRARVETSDALADDADSDEAWALLKSLIGQNAVICSHGDLIQKLMKRLVDAGLSPGSRLFYSKGSIWEVEVDGGKFTTGTYFAPPGK